MPPVTIVTPSYNQGPFLEATVRSVLEQGYPLLEYLVIDGGSTDETVDILRRYEDRLTWVSERDSGQADALNKGFRRARGEIVAWLNSDDVYLPGAIAKAVDFLERNPSIAMVYGDADYIDSSGDVLGPYFTQDFDLRHLTLSCFVCQPTVFMRRDALAAVGFLDQSLHYVMDYDLWIRLAQRFQVGYLAEKLACYRAHPAAKTFAGRENSYQEAIRTVKKHFGYVPYPWCIGLADYRLNKLDQYFERRPVTRLAEWAGLALFLRHNLGSARGIRHARDCFAGRSPVRWLDGWVTREFQCRLRPEQDDRFIEFHGQHLLSQSRLDLEVRYNGVIWERGTVAQVGPFVFAVEIPQRAVDRDQDTVSLCSVTLGRLPRDCRSLSFLLEDVLIFKEGRAGSTPRRIPGFRPTYDALGAKWRLKKVVRQPALR